MTLDAPLPFTHDVHPIPHGTDVEQDFQADPGEAQRHLLVTGGAGYIGSTLTELALERGWAVTVLDRFFFGDTLRDLRDSPRLRTVRGDVRDLDPALLDGVDAVVDMAALSNDPSGELDPAKTEAINRDGRARVAELAQDRGVDRYVVASSCSLYGSQEGLVDETSEPNPLTTYARCNREVEKATLPLGDDDFTATALRQATVFGLSRRMRYDLVVNGMTWALFEFGQIKVMRDGTQWRPLVHVRDTSRAFLETLEADPDLVNGEIFNVGHEDLNVQIRPLAERVTKACGHEFELEWYGDPDDRTYRASFEKIRDHLGFVPEHDIEDGARTIFRAFHEGMLDPDDPTTQTVDWYTSLLEGGEAAEEVRLDGRIL